MKTKKKQEKCKQEAEQLKGKAVSEPQQEMNQMSYFSKNVKIKVKMAASVNHET